MSQLDLALAVGTPTRHLSFVETGRAAPSREMVVAFADALAVPLRERNTLLLSAGYAPLYGETPLEAPEMAQVNGALDHILRANAAFPTLIVNSRYDLVRANRAAHRLFAFLLPRVEQSGPPNMLRLLFTPGLLRDRLLNWDQVAAATLARLQREALSTATHDELRTLIRELTGTNGHPPDLTRSPPLLLPLMFKVGKETLSLFSTFTTLGTPLDLTLQELRIETLFPADPPSAETLAAIVAPPKQN
jgi:transcriptional regulator with XRE-family HTH domain